MATCINKNHPDFLALHKATGVNKEYLAAYVSEYQEKNNVEVFPSAKELLDFQLSNISVQEFNVEDSNVNLSNNVTKLLINDLKITEKLMKAFDAIEISNEDAKEASSNELVCTL